MKDKLTLKDLAPYLPYELKYRHNYPDGTFGISTVTVLNALNFTDDTTSDRILLRSLSDLTKEIEVNGERFVPLIELFKIIRPFDDYARYTNGRTNNQIWFYDAYGTELFWIMYDSKEQFFDVRSSKGDKLLQRSQLKAFDKLHQWHFDTRDLIGRGLAIDINTIK